MSQKSMNQNQNFENVEPLSTIVTKEDHKDYIDLKDNNYYPKALLEKKFRNLFLTIPHTDINYKQLHETIQDNTEIQYIITCEEKHKDGDEHIHQLIIFKRQVRLGKIHKLIIKQNKTVRGTINYQSPKDIPAVNQYIKKDNKYIQSGNELIADNKTGKTGAQPKSFQEHQHISYQNLIKTLDNTDITKEEAIQYLKDNHPRDFILHNDKIMKIIDNHYDNKNILKWDIPTLDMDKITLKHWQQELWDLIHTPPKPRRIIWIQGDYGIGKSFMTNYIDQNYKYRAYNAGQCVSLDSVVYGYNEEGAIIWDIPRNFDWNNLTTPFCNVVEKFSDVGQYLTSKKYSGHKARVLGHTIIFSNAEPPEELKHRDIHQIRTDYTVTKDGKYKRSIQTMLNQEHYTFNTKEELLKSYGYDTDIETENEEE